MKFKMIAGISTLVTLIGGYLLYKKYFNASGAQDLFEFTGEDIVAIPAEYMQSIGHIHIGDKVYDFIINSDNEVEYINADR